jgi:hypothetical protein
MGGSVAKEAGWFMTATHCRWHFLQLGAAPRDEAAANRAGRSSFRL